MHWLSRNDTWSLQLNSLSLVWLNGTSSVNGISESIHDSSEHSLSNGDVNNGSSSLDNMTFLDLSKGKGISAKSYLSLPKTTIPTLSVSKLRAIPFTPEENSTISPAWTLVSPKTLAIPSPIEITVPNSLRSFCRKRINNVIWIWGWRRNGGHIWLRETYHLTDVRNFGLQNSHSISDGGLLGTEGSIWLVNEVGIMDPCEQLGQHLKFILNLYIYSLLIYS